MDIVADSRFDGMTVRDLLRSHLGYSSNMIKKLKFSEGGITVNGKFVTVRYEISAGDVISLAVEDKPSDVSPYTIPSPIPIDVIYEDEWLTAVNKPADMPSHPSCGHRLDTVSNALAYRYREKNYVFRPVNRLDRDTSGCMLTANSKAAAYKMYISMTGGMIRKTYLALTDGVPANGSGVLRSYLKREEGSIVKRCTADQCDPESKEALTEYEVLCSHRSHALIALRPITGRTHQLRVQLTEIGCPITGDDMYGNTSEYIARQALHSFITELPHPESKERLVLRAPLHDDMIRAVVAVFGEDILELINAFDVTAKSD